MHHLKRAMKVTVVTERTAIAPAVARRSGSKSRRASPFGRDQRKSRDGGAHDTDRGVSVRLGPGEA